jgi:molybdate transport system substrate-binding protein
MHPPAGFYTTKTPSGHCLAPSYGLNLTKVIGHGMPKLLCGVAALIAMTTGLSAADLVVFSGGAPEAALRTLGPRFEKASGHKVTYEFAIVTALQKRLLDGEKADVIFLPMPLIGEIEKALPLRKEGRGPLARVGLAVVVREGTPLPDLSTAASFKKALLGAKSIALSEASTPGGAYVLRMLGDGYC